MRYQVKKVFAISIGIIVLILAIFSHFIIADAVKIIASEYRYPTYFGIHYYSFDIFVKVVAPCIEGIVLGYLIGNHFHLSFLPSGKTVNVVCKILEYISYAVLLVFVFIMIYFAFTINTPIWMNVFILNSTRYQFFFFLIYFILWFICSRKKVETFV